MSRWIGLPERFRSSTRGPRRRAAGLGFTLLEVVVAVAILSLALGVLMQVFSTGLRASRAAEQRAIAALLAQSKLAAMGVEEPLEEGEASGEFERGYRWRTTVHPYIGPDDDESDWGNLGAYEVAVTVSWGEGVGEGESLVLTTLRLAPLP